jgi:DNA processing protein
VSEYAPGTKTQKSFFRARNRIGSGLSAGVVAIEAPLGSGTLLYVAEAIEQGRDIFAVPGNADSPKSEGTNELIKNGAKAVTCGNDIMEEYRIRYKGRLKALPANTDKTPDLSPALKHGDKSVDKKEERGYIDLSDYLKSLSVNQLAIISAIESPGTGVDDIIERSGLPAASVLSDLTILQIKGFVIQESGKRFTLNFKK